MAYLNNKRIKTLAYFNFDNETPDAEGAGHWGVTDVTDATCRHLADMLAVAKGALIAVGREDGAGPCIQIEGFDGWIDISDLCIWQDGFTDAHLNQG